jgi:branched-chain amino acid transport system permease protein
MTPFMGDSVALKGLTVIVLGGLGSIEGAVIGGFLVAGIEVFSVALGRSDFRDAVVFLLLFLILLARPQGLLGQPLEDRA